MSGLRRPARAPAKTLSVVLLFVVIAASAWAQGAPFGVPAASPAATGNGLIGWILGEQASLYRALSKLVRDSKADGSALWLLAGFSFLYGILHAAGPGHGKAVISSYLVASNESWKRGVLLSGLSSLLQAVVAISVVGIGAVLLQVTARSMGAAIRIIEIVSYLLIMAIGVRLLWKSAPAFVRSVRIALRGHHSGALSGAPGGSIVSQSLDDACCSYHARFQLRQVRDGDGLLAAQGTLPTGTRGSFACSDAGTAKDSASWREALSAVVATGARPCSGAILILVFAFSQQLYGTGMISALLMGVGTAVTVAAFAIAAVFLRDVAVRFAGFRSDIGSLVMSGIATAAAMFVVAFGGLLLAGYIASERIGMFG